MSTFTVLKVYLLHNFHKLHVYLSAQIQVFKRSEIGELDNNKSILKLYSGYLAIHIFVVQVFISTTWYR